MKGKKKASAKGKGVVVEVKRLDQKQIRQVRDALERLTTVCKGTQFQVMIADTQYIWLSSKTARVIKFKQQIIKPLLDYKEILDAYLKNTNPFVS